MIPAPGIESDTEGGNVGCLNLNVTAIENLRVGPGALPVFFKAIQHDPAHAIVAEREGGKTQAVGIGVTA